MENFMIVGILCALVISLIVNIWQYIRKVSAITEVSEQQHLILPDGWWSDGARFQTERRAIFSQAWMCVSHRGRFRRPGDYIVYDVAGFRFFMILGKDMIVRSFHNVCRHRAFPVARKQSGSATVLGCRYHGWSYDTTGSLVKAPYFDNLPGFDRSQNSLFEILTKQDRNGFLHVNVSRMNSTAVGVPPRGVQVGKHSSIKSDSPLLDTIELGGKFNWKVTLNRQSATNTSTVSSTGVMRVFSARGSTPMGELHFHPLTTVHTMSGRPFWYQLTFSPENAQQTKLRCDVYATNPAGRFKYEDTVKEALEKEIQDRVRDLESQHRELLSSRHSAIGNSDQAKIYDAVKAHLKQETLQGLEIKPAEVKGQASSSKLSKADKICQAMDCVTAGKLDW